MNIVFTVCDRHTLANAKVLADAVSQHEPDVIFYLAWVDTLELPVLSESIKVLDVADAGISDFDQMCARYYDFELLPACRPWFARKIQELEPAFDTLTFLAPTTYLFESFLKLQTVSADLYLTPNITEPLKKDARLDDKRILNIGMFHAGAWTIRRSRETTMLLDWWAHRTIDRARFDLCNGMCMDQLWLNYAPVWIPETTQLATPAWHYGLWSVLNHKLVSKNNRYLVGDQGLVSADFAGLTGFDPVWSDHVSLLSENAAFGNLYKDYSKKILTQKTSLTDENIPGYGVVVKISKQRLLRRNLVTKLRALNRFIDKF